MDDRTCIVQPYLPDSRGVESPTIVTEKQDDPACTTHSSRCSRPCGTEQRTPPGDRRAARPPTDRGASRRTRLRHRQEHHASRNPPQRRP
ncbi:hypothetical protein [Actinophytocola algeriensis]|uniref:hypothetical protein n=1 Tax=Actinophytocola algeriensis TaxID=1768010 RepID=UPI002892CB35|nr:hypothetical protein [Actinophytocola algeriensis]